MSIKLSNEDIVKLYLKKSCNISATCSAMNITRTTWYRWIKDDVAFKSALNDAEEALLDNAETMLYKKVMMEDMTAIIFTLKTKGKKRGYTERIEYEDVGDTVVLTREQKLQKIKDLENKAKQFKTDIL